MCFYYDFLVLFCFFFFKQKTAYEMCGRDWSSDVCSSDLKIKAPIYSGEVRRVQNVHDKSPVFSLSDFGAKIAIIDFLMFSCDALVRVC